MSPNANGILVVAAVLHRQNEILIVRRGPSQSGAGFWEFPGGKVEAAESPQQALKREIQEELGIAIEVGDLIGERLHAYPKKTIRLRIYWARPLQEGLALTEHDAFQWLRPEVIKIDELSEADRPFVPAIIAQIPGRS